jgi:putative toxin-antitoxin system antitoxin component (TIGR02293 family)
VHCADADPNARGSVYWQNQGQPGTLREDPAHQIDEVIFRLRGSIYRNKSLMATRNLLRRTGKLRKGIQKDHKGATYQTMLGLIRSKDIPRLIRRIEAGISYQLVQMLAHALRTSSTTIAGAIGLSQRTFQRHGLGNGILPRSAGEHAVRLMQLLERAIATFEDEDMARSWLNEPNEILNDRTPIDYAGTGLGCDQVERLLARIEQGVYW